MDVQVSEIIVDNKESNNEFVKTVDWCGNVVYEIPYKYPLLNLEEYVNFLRDRSEYIVRDRYMIDDLRKNYDHIKYKLFNNTLMLAKQDINDLNRVLFDIIGWNANEPMVNLVEIIGNYINGLTLLVTLDTSNENIVNRLNDFDLNLLKDLNIKTSSEIEIFANIYYFFNIILSSRYLPIYTHYVEAVDEYIKKHGMKNNVNDLASKFYIRDIYSVVLMPQRPEETKYVVKPFIGGMPRKSREIKYIKDPFTGKGYVSTINSYYKHEITDIIPDINGNIKLIASASGIVKNSGFLSDEETFKFKHMDNMRRLNIIKEKLVDEDKNIINNYPYNNTIHDPIYKIDYRPLIYVVLKYDPKFLEIHHDDIESDIVDVLEKL